MSELKSYPLPGSFEESHQEALSLVWTLREKGIEDRAGIERSFSRFARATDLWELESSGCVRTSGGRLVFTPAGEKQAADVVRRSRLAERLLTDVLRLSADEAEEEACRLEHILSEHAADAICAVLGHPEACPHGAPIPRGRCCESAVFEAVSVLRPLDRLEPGEEGTVAYLSYPDRPDTQRLLALGVVPGTSLLLEATSPAFVVKAGESTVAMERAVARGVYVRTGAGVGK